MISAAAASSSCTAASAVTILTGGPLSRCGVGVLALSCDRCDGVEHLGCHVSWKSVHSSSQV